MRIAIDDFGTGYSSLAYLQRFPVDALKIDRSFIARVGQDPEGETLIRTLVQLGKSLSIETLAEGIEQSRELSLLQEEHCDSGQGFLFARPLDVDACGAFLQEWSGGAGAVPSDVPGSMALSRASPKTPPRWLSPLGGELSGTLSAGPRRDADRQGALFRRLSPRRRPRRPAFRRLPLRRRPRARDRARAVACTRLRAQTRPAHTPEESE